nr:MAG TPA: Metallo-peptidase family M12B Reprolysin-like [Caudoviricetes sp.]
MVMGHHLGHFLVGTFTWDIFAMSHTNVPLE